MTEQPIGGGMANRNDVFGRYPRSFDEGLPAQQIRTAQGESIQLDTVFTRFPGLRQARLPLPPQARQCTGADIFFGQQTRR